MTMKGWSLWFVAATITRSMNPGRSGGRRTATTMATWSIPDFHTIDLDLRECPQVTVPSQAIPPCNTSAIQIHFAFAGYEQKHGPCCKVDTDEVGSQRIPCLTNPPEYSILGSHTLDVDQQGCHREASFSQATPLWSTSAIQFYFSVGDDGQNHGPS